MNRMHWSDFAFTHWYQSIGIAAFIIAITGVAWCLWDAHKEYSKEDETTCKDRLDVGSVSVTITRVLK